MVKVEQPCGVLANSDCYLRAMCESNVDGRLEAGSSNLNDQRCASMEPGERRKEVQEDMVLAGMHLINKSNTVAICESRKIRSSH